MLSVHALAGGGARYYLSLTGYYCDGPEPDGYWYGEGTPDFNLVGLVTAHQIERLCEGWNPETSTTGKLDKLVQNAGSQRRYHGDDLTFSAPKSVSITWVMATPELREKIKDAFHRACQDALNYIQERAGYARKGAQGQEVQRARLIFALFEHCTSRLADPHLHLHCVCPNVTKHDQGPRRTTAIDSTHFFRHKMAAGALMRASLAKYLRELGFRIEPDRFSFRIQGVSQELCEAMSKRRHEIVEAILEKYQDVPGIHGRELTAIVKAASSRMAEIVTLETRRGKPEWHSRDAIFAFWNQIATQYGVNHETIENLRVQLPEILNQKNQPLLERAIFEAGIERVSEQHSHFTERDVIQAVAEEAQWAGFDANQVRTIVDREFHRRRDLIVELGELTAETKSAARHCYVDRDELRYSTIENIRVELELIDRVSRMARERVSGRSEAAISEGPYLGGPTKRAIQESQQKLAQKQQSLSPDQLDAIWHLTGQERICCLSGRAGTGKSTTLKAARIAWEKLWNNELGFPVETAVLAWQKEGRRVIGCAVAGLAARNLEKASGIKSQTLMKLLYRLKKQQWVLKSNDVVVLDEAGMVTTRDLLNLVRHVDRAGAKLVLVGDPRQLQPIGAGGPYSSMTRRIKGIEKTLTTVFRQRETWRAEAGILFSEGKAREAIEAYRAHDEFHVVQTKAEVIKSLVDQWEHDGGIREPDQVLLGAATNTEVLAVNRTCQERRLNAGAICERRMLVGSNFLHEGDYVLLWKNDSKLDVTNGFRGVVTRVDRICRTIDIALEGDNRTVTIPVDRYGTDKITLGYCASIHKFQGSTHKKLHVLLGGSMWDRHMAYVASTRSEESTHFFVDRETIQGERRETLEQSIERFTNALSRDATKNLALDILQRGSATEPDHGRLRTLVNATQRPPAPLHSLLQKPERQQVSSEPRNPNQAIPITL